jgi:two-component system LytT family response regulator
MRTIIVDDEKKGRESLITMLNDYCKGVEIVGQASTAEEAIAMIKREDPQLIFLDVEMPRGDGFYLLEQFEQIRFRVIFTTAHENYAIQAIRHHALDYLLKPIDIDELKNAVEKARKLISNLVPVNPYMEMLSDRKAEMNGRVALPVKDGLVYIQVADIIRIESDGSYSIIYSAHSKKYIASKNIGEYENILPSKYFFRIHKSHLVNIQKVKKYIRTDGYFAEMEDGSIIEISRRKKDEFLQAMERMD